MSAVATCRTLASCAGTADEVQVTIAHGSVAANNLLPVAVAQRSGDGGVTATTALSYDPIGDTVAVDGPLSGTADTTTYRYDDVRQLVGVISADPDGSGSLKRRAQRLTYDAKGAVTKAEVGTVAGVTDSAWAAFVTKQQLTTSYDSHGRKTRDVVTAGGATYGVTDYSYDGAGRPDCTATRMNPSTWATVTAACTAQSAGPSP
ncbi:hypothetical protein EAH87_02890 [Sphingomonas koreensis]|nr:hypothetical protein EAH87_02890 [Sphingomonas koreensis]